MKTNEKYFAGGFDPNHPSNNVNIKTIDNEDGTGVKYVYDINGTLVSEEVLVLPLPEPELVDPYEVYAQAIADAQTMEEVRAAGAALAAALIGEV